MYLLDTNVLSELRRPRPSPNVLAWIKTVDVSHLHISAITVGEIQKGIESIRSRDPEKANELDLWLSQVIRYSPLLAFDVDAGLLWGKLVHSHPNHNVEDLMIAAIAWQHGLIVVTRNTKDFLIPEIQSFNPFDFPV
ncbi:MAG: type II toxin-antitoxin system VapC family toxin [Magnetococcales bacterium]|nr:type II toxin-antitoxin system VapC family toxin [Magnetococcales bacterium]